MNTKELLTEALGYIKRGWCKRTNARKAGGCPTIPESKEACAWCANGALLVSYMSGKCNSDTLNDAQSILDRMCSDEGSSINTFVRYNDEPGRTQVEVVDLFERAIASIPDGE